MNGYSKIKIIQHKKSRSVDFSDFPNFPQTPKSVQNTIDSKPTPKIQEPNQINNTNNYQNEEDRHSSSDEIENNTGERFNNNNNNNNNNTLRRNCSVSSTSGIQYAVKRAFSMRRSSSVSESYCRIHDQSVTLASPIDDEEGWDTIEESSTRSVKKSKQRGNKILKACKRLFGL